jgi:tetratricopeptide (TPR) repeat protein
MSRVVALVLLLEAVALAQPTPDQAVQAKQLWDDGRKLAASGKYQQACDDFTKSYALDPAVGTELNLGDCQEHLGHLAIAWHLFEDAATKDSDADRAKYARGRADALTGKLATAIVKLPDASTVGLVLEVGGQLVPPAAEVQTKVDPGSVVVELDVPGHAAETRTLPAKPGETVTFDFAAPSPVVAPPTDEPVPTTTVSVEKRRHSRVVLAEGLVASGGALMLASVGVALYAKSQYDDQVGPGKPCDSGVRCSDAAAISKVNHAIHIADAATVIGLVGLAAAVAGGVVWATAPKEFVVAPEASARGAGITLSGTF